MILVDTNILIDILTSDPKWCDWSLEVLKKHSSIDKLAINPIVYAELSGAFKTQTELDEVIKELSLERLEIPYEAAFLAGKAFLEYRKKGGSKSSPLPDFFIGAHALTKKYKLITRDVNRYKSYFPKLPLIHP